MLPAETAIRRTCPVAGGIGPHAVVYLQGVSQARTSARAGECGRARIRAWAAALARVRGRKRDAQARERARGPAGAQARARAGASAGAGVLARAEP